MSDYNSLRLKRNAQIQNALSNVRNDLYEWKSSSSKINTSKPFQNRPSYTPPLRLKSLDSIESAESLSSTSNNRFGSNSNLNLNPARKVERAPPPLPPPAAPSAPVEFLSTFDTSLDLLQTKEKVYLNSARKGNRPLVTKKNQNELENEFKLKVGQKNANLVSEMDLSQFDLAQVPNLLRFKFLKFLDVSCNRIKCLENLKFKNLIELRAFANQIETIENLEDLTDLQSLQLQANRIKKLNKSLFNLRKLEYLRLDQNCLDSISSHEITCCPNLIYLNISHNNIESLNFINYLPSLEEIDCSYLHLTTLEGIDHTRCKKLSEINLSHNSLCENKLSIFENFQALTCLKVANNCLKSVEQISRIKNLKDLDVSCNQIETIKELANLVDLETLDISRNKINDLSQFESLVLCEQLVELECFENPVFDGLVVESNVSESLPNLRFLNRKKVNQPKESTEDVSVKRSLGSKGMTFLNMEIVNFEQEIEIFNQNFMARFNEILQCLNESNSVLVTTPELKNPTTASKTSLLYANSPRNSAKHRLMQALMFSKKIDDV